jgi:hypothetical protein
LIGNWRYTWDYHGYTSTFLFEIDSSGNLLLNKTIDAGAPNSIAMISNKGYIIFGERQRSGGGSAFSLVQTDLNGNIQWSKEYKPENAVSAYEHWGILTNDGGYLLGGNGNAGDYGWLVKTDSQGNMLWNKTYSYKGYLSDILSISQVDDGEFVFVGTAMSNTSNPVGWFPDTRFFTSVGKMDTSGNLLGEIGIEMGNNATHPTSIIQAEDGGCLFVGTWNESYEASSAQRFWLVKVSLK